MGKILKKTFQELWYKTEHNEKKAAIAFTRYLNARKEKTKAKYLKIHNKYKGRAVEAMHKANDLQYRYNQQYLKEHPRKE